MCASGRAARAVNVSVARAQRRRCALSAELADALLLLGDLQVDARRA